MRDVAASVAVEIVAAVLVPIVAGEMRTRLSAVGGDVERVARKNVVGEGRALGAGEKAHAPAVRLEVIASGNEPGCAIGDEPGGVAGEDVADQGCVVHFLEQQ